MAGAKPVVVRLHQPIDEISNSGDRITASDRWMPKSGYGPYCTIPSSSGIDPSLLKSFGLPSFASARREIQLLAEEYAERAAALVARAKQDRIRLSQDVVDLDAEQLIRPYRLRLCLATDNRDNYLYLGWRGVVKQRGRWTRIRAYMSSCRSDLDRLVADASPAEKEFVNQIEKEAADIRRRWFALVRLVHYMNVAEDHRLSDLEAGLVHIGRAKENGSPAMRRLRGLFRRRVHES